MDKFVERNFMKEREQKTAAQAADCLQGDRLEAESLTGVQTFMEITEDKLVEVQIDEKHLMEVIVSPYNMNRAYRKVISNGGSGGVDSMEAKELLPYLKLHTDELKASILNGTYKPQPVRRVEIQVTARMKRYFWHKYYETVGGFGRKKNGKLRQDKRNAKLGEAAEFYKHMALMKVGSKITIPRRRFLGYSPEIEKAVTEVIEDNLEQYFKTIKGNDK